MKEESSYYINATLKSNSHGQISLTSFITQFWIPERHS